MSGLLPMKLPEDLLSPERIRACVHSVWESLGEEGRSRLSVGDLMTLAALQNAVPAERAESQGGFLDMAEACEIFAKHNKDQHVFWCEHDTLHACVEAEGVSPADVDRLEKLGFHVDQGGGGFYSFRHGSC